MLLCASGCPPLRGKLADSRRLRRQLRGAADQSALSRHSDGKSLGNRLAQSGGWFHSVVFVTANRAIPARLRSCGRPKWPNPPPAEPGVISNFRKPERSRTISIPACGSIRTLREAVGPALLEPSARRDLQNKQSDIPELPAACKPRREGW